MSKYAQGLTSGGQLLAVVILVGFGYVVGVTSRDATVHADVRREQEQEPFQTGDQRCEVVLREIAVTIGKMDERLERMEKLANQFVNRSAGPLPGETRQR
jgi:uncharacterized protein HemX